jgi:thymidine kinase
MKKGNLELAIGPMFAGKTTWLINSIENEVRENVLLAHFFLDTRYAADSIVTHDGKRLTAIAAKSEKDIMHALQNRPTITTLGLDELQFFEPSIVSFFARLKDNGLKILTAGLNVDYDNNRWETTKAVMSIADTIHELRAVCAVCGQKNATITNRKGKKEGRVVIGGSELYEALCEKDYYKTFTVQA